MELNINIPNILTVVKKYINNLEKKGQYYFAKCPFHNENTPSFVVNVEKGYFKCFGCGAYGDAIEFVKLIENLTSRKEAIKKIAQDFNIELPNIYQNKNYKENLLLKKASHLYNKILTSTKSGSNAYKYLKERGINDDLIKEFNLGFVNEEANNILNALIEEDSDLNISKEDFKKIKSLYLEKIDDGKVTSYFKDRLVIPVLNEDNQIVGFVGRLINSQKEFKYLNSKDSDIFKRQDLVFNLGKAKANLNKNKELIIVEGLFDVISLYKVGYKNVVATFGTQVSNNQIRKIINVSKNLIIFFDGDKAGLKGTLELFTKIKKIDESVKINIVHNKIKKDPDEIVRQCLLKDMTKGPVYEIIFDLKSRQNDKIENKLFELLSYESNTKIQKDVLVKWSSLNDFDYKMVQNNFLNYLDKSRKDSMKDLSDKIISNFMIRENCIKYFDLVIPKSLTLKKYTVIKKMYSYHINNKKFILKDFLNCLDDVEKDYVVTLKKRCDNVLFLIKKYSELYFNTLIKQLK